MHFYIFKDIARTLVLPPLGLLILAVLGAVLIGRQRRRAGWSCLIIGLGSLWLLSTPLIADELARLTQGYPAFDPAIPTNAQAIVILGGGEGRLRAPEYAGRPATSLDLLERLNYGAWLARITQLPILHSILLVTSSTHMLRATREFLATGLQVTAAPVHVLGRRSYAATDYLPSAEGIWYSNRAIYELLGERTRELLAVLNLRRQHPG
jgi:uncharacterized SAM-binding protein YcdF (DUF218 family)